MRVAIFAAALLAMLSVTVATGRTQITRHLLSIEQLVAEAPALEGKTVRTKGYLVVEPENRALWKWAATYKQQEDPCIKLFLTNEMLNRKEEFSRREVVVQGTVQVETCGAGTNCIVSCEGISLRSVQVKSFATPPDPQILIPQSFAGDKDLVIDGTTQDAAGIRLFGRHVAETIRAVSEGRAARAAILKHFGPSSRVRLGKEVDDRVSRVGSFLFDGSNSLARTTASARIVVNSVQRPPIGSQLPAENFVCYCTGGYCDPKKLTIQRIYWRAAADPHKCIPVVRSGRDWKLDAGFLLGFDQEAEENRP